MTISIPAIEPPSGAVQKETPHAAKIGRVDNAHSARLKLLAGNKRLQITRHSASYDLETENRWRHIVE